MRYVPTVTTEVSSGESPLAEALEKRGDEQAGIMSQVGQFAQKKVDEQEQQEGEQDAIKAYQKGEQWQPEENFTEAGRAYNSGALPVAKVMTSNDIQSHIQNLYHQQLLQPLGDNTLPDFKKVISSYMGATLNNTPTPLHGSVIAEVENAASMYGRKLSDTLAQHTLYANKLNAMQQTTTATNAATNAILNLPIGATDDNYKGVQSLINIANSAMSNNAQTSGFTPAEQMKRANGFREGAYQASVMNRYYQIKTLASTPGLTPVEKNMAMQKLADYVNDPQNDDALNEMQSKFAIDPRNISQSAQVRAQNLLYKRFSEFKASEKTSSIKNESLAADGVARSKEGMPYNANLPYMTQLQITNSKGYEIGHTAGMAAFNNGQSKAQMLENLSKQKYDNEQSKFAAIQNATRVYNQQTALGKEDPVLAVQSSTASHDNDLLQQYPNSAPIVNNVLNDPTQLLTKTLDPKAKQLLLDVYANKVHATQAANLKQGILKAQGLQSLKTTLNQAPYIERSSMLDNLKYNLQGQNNQNLYPVIKDQLTRGKHPVYKALMINDISSISPVVGQKLNKVEQLKLEDPKLYNDISNKVNNSVIAAMAPYNKTVLNTVNVGNNGQAKSTAEQSIVKDLAVHQYMTSTNQKSDQAATKAYQDWIETQYYPINNRDYHVPKQIETKSGSIKIDQSSVNSAVDNLDVKPMLKDDAGVPENVSNRAIKIANAISVQQNGHFVNDANEKDLIYVDQNGHVVMGRDNRPIRINFVATTQHPLPVSTAAKFNEWLKETF